MQAELAALCAAGEKSERITDPHDKTETHTIVGVDELDFEPDALSWISPLGKALLASQLGDRITLEDGRTVKIVKIE